MTDVELTLQAEEHLEGLDPEARERVLTKLDEAREWTEHRLDPLSGYPYYKLRAGDYRAIIAWDRDADVLVVEAVGHRRNVYRKSSESASGLDPEGESRKRYYPTACSFGRDGLRGPVGRKHGGCTNSRRSIRRAPKRPSSTIGRGWAESSQRGRTPVESGTALSPFRTMEVPTPKREAATLAVAVVHDRHLPP